MNPINRTNFTSRFVTTSVIATAISLTAMGQNPKIAEAQNAQATTESEGHAPKAKTAAAGGLKVVSSQTLDQDGQQQTFELRVEGDRITAVRNGKQLPASAIKREGERIIILDEHGNEIRDLHIFKPATADQLNLLSTADGAWAPSVTADQFMWSTGEQPTVVIGVQMGDPGPALEKHLKLKPGACTMITGVYEGLPAQKAGLGEYDIIVQVDGEEAADRQTLRQTIVEKKPGETIRLRVIQEGQPKDVTVEIAPYDKEKMATAKFHGQVVPQYQGLVDSLNALQPGMAPQIDLQHMPDVFVAPDFGSNPNRKELEQFYGTVLRPNRSDVTEKLERLDARMAELEVLLQRLIEQKQNQR